MRIIARGTSLSPSAVSNRITFLVQHGLIEEVHRSVHGTKVWAITRAGARAVEGEELFVPRDSAEELFRAAVICDLMTTDETAEAGDVIAISAAEIDADLELGDAGPPGPPDYVYGYTGRYVLRVMPTVWGVPVVPTRHTPTYVVHRISDHPTTSWAVAHEVLWEEPDPQMFHAVLQAYSAAPMFAAVTFTCATAATLAAVTQAVDDAGAGDWATVRELAPSRDLQWAAPQS